MTEQEIYIFDIIRHSPIQSRVFRYLYMQNNYKKWVVYVNFMYTKRSKIGACPLIRFDDLSGIDFKPLWKILAELLIQQHPYKHTYPLIKGVRQNTKLFLLMLRQDPYAWSYYAKSGADGRSYNALRLVCNHFYQPQTTKYRVDFDLVNFKIIIKLLQKWVRNRID